MLSVALVFGFWQDPVALTQEQHFHRIQQRMTNNTVIFCQIPNNSSFFLPVMSMLFDTIGVTLLFDVSLFFFKPPTVGKFCF